ncbi:MAG TPA: hypothetical protein DHV85_14250, partial [Candidatus Accumulibacter sp.]|nr:hypothetical protein [Accumulibacter sp.]
IVRSIFRSATTLPAALSTPVALRPMPRWRVVVPAEPRRATAAGGNPIERRRRDDAGEGTRDSGARIVRHDQRDVRRAVAGATASMAPTVQPARTPTILPVFILLLR